MKPANIKRAAAPIAIPKRSLRITFVMPFLRLTGGLKVIVEYANGLAARGHHVTGVVPSRLRPLPLGLNQVEYLWRRHWMLRKYRWFDPQFEVRVVPSLEAMWAPDGDVVVASSWQTALFVDAYPSRCGRKVYYIQGVETWKDPELAAKTYRLPLFRIATTNWIAQELRRDFDAQVDAIVPYGIDSSLHTGEPRPAKPAARFGMLYNPTVLKGFPDGLEAFKRVHERHPETRLIVFGSAQRRLRLPSYVEFVGPLGVNQTPSFYRSIDAWIAPSRWDGFGLTPLEAMAAGCAVVTTRVGGTPYFAIDEETALVCKPGDVDGLERAIERLATDGKLVARLSAAGVTRARSLPFERSLRDLESALHRAVIGAEA